MLNDVEQTFAAYSREELEQTLRSMDPEKTPADYAAVQAALARALPAVVGQSRLDVAGLRALMAEVRPSPLSQVSTFLAAIILTVIQMRFLFPAQAREAPLTLFWVVLAIALPTVVWVAAILGVGRAYRFSNGRITYLLYGQAVWSESLSDLVWVDRRIDRYRGEWLVFHWPRSTRRVSLRVNDFKRFDLNVSRA